MLIKRALIKRVADIGNKAKMYTHSLLARFNWNQIFMIDLGRAQASRTPRIDVFKIADKTSKFPKNVFMNENCSHLQPSKLSSLISPLQMRYLFIRGFWRTWSDKVVKAVSSTTASSRDFMLLLGLRAWFLCLPGCTVWFQRELELFHWHDLLASFALADKLHKTRNSQGHSARFRAGRNRAIRLHR